MKKPTHLYRLVVKATDNSRPWRYAERGGGTYTSAVEALKARDRHRTLGREAEVFVTECDWRQYS